jgi:protein-disulfide isomerase
MRISRRFLLGVGPVAIAGAGLLRAQAAWAADDPRMGERALGKADAPVTATEWFSLTCPHCAAFHRESLPTIKTQLIDTGKLRLIYRDFPLDQVALAAAMVARALPAERYESFIGALFASQDRWAFNRSVNPIDELAKMAALAGMPRDTFNATLNDQAFRLAILKGQQEAEQVYKVDSTPTFILNGPKAKDRREAGAKSAEDFARLVAEAAG